MKIFRKKSYFKNKLKNDGSEFRSKNMTPREMRTVFKQKSKAYKSFRKAKVLSRCLTVKKKIMEAELKLKEFYDKRVKVEEDKVF